MLFKNRAYFDQIALNLGNLGYVVEWKLLNAFNFGVPQKRERLFVVAHKGKFHFPKALECDGFTAGDALGELAFEVLPSTKFLTKSMDE